MVVKIRKYKKGDENSFKQSIVEMQQLERTYKDGYLPPEKMVKKWFKYTIRETKANNGEIYVGEVDSKQAGFLAIRLDPPSIESEIYAENEAIAFISHFYVFPHFRGLGIGKKLMSQVQEYSLKKQVQHVRTFICAENRRARSIYKKFGFEELDVLVSLKV